MPIFLLFGQEASLALKSSVNFYFSAAVCRITAASRVSATPSPFTSALAVASASRLVSSALAARTDTLSLVVTAPSPFTSPRRRAAAIFSVRLLTAALISLCTASALSYTFCASAFTVASPSIVDATYASLVPEQTSCFFHQPEHHTFLIL